MMKKILISFLMLLSMASIGQTIKVAQEERVISPQEKLKKDYQRLPKKAQEFLEQHFKTKIIEKIYFEKEGHDRYEYKVRYADELTIEFDNNGEWTEIEHKFREVPISVLPRKIVEYLTKLHKGEAIKKVERERLEYEIKLKNGKELIFDSQGNFKKYD